MVRTMRDRATRPESLQAYTVDEVASLLRVGPQRIRDLIHAGKLTGRRLGVELRVLRCDLEDYLEAVISDGPDPRRNPRRKTQPRKPQTE